jgi:hypothetical protein
VTADLAQAAAGVRRLEAGQFNYDLLASLDPALLDIPYDLPVKSPTEEVRAQLTLVDLPETPEPGQVWAGPSITQPVTDRRDEQLLLLREMVDRAARNSFTRSFWGKEAITGARDVMDRLARGVQIDEGDGARVAAILASEMTAPELPADVAKIVTSRHRRTRARTTGHPAARQSGESKSPETNSPDSLLRRITRSTRDPLPRDGTTT